VLHNKVFPVVSACLLVVSIISCGKVGGGSDGSSSGDGGGSGDVAGDAGEGVSWVEFTADNGSTIRALYKEPDQAARSSVKSGGALPAIIYNHGSYVEDHGYDQSVSDGYDVKDFVTAIAGAGYVALAPIRPADSNFEDGIISAGIGYLKGLNGVDSGRIYMIGHSKGGAQTILAAIKYGSDLNAVAVTAPAITTGSRYNTILSQLDGLDIPIYVALGLYEPNSAIAKYVPMLVSELQTRGKNVESRLDYPGDHKWFWTVRDEYWSDIMSFLGRY